MHNIIPRFNFIWFYTTNSEHAKELNNAVPETPFFFLKPTSSYLENGGDIELPQGCEVHHESKYKLKSYFFHVR